MERDAESALDHTWFRQYSSAQARWLSPDPLGGDISNPQSLNRYSYVLNDPINFIDPLGLFCTPPGGPGEHGEQCIEPTKSNNAGSTSIVPTLAQGGTVLATWIPGHETETGFIPGYWSYSFVHEPRFEDPTHPPGWWETFGKEFFRGTNRREGESFTTCVVRTANEATLGGHKAILGTIVSGGASMISFETGATAWLGGKTAWLAHKLIPGGITVATARTIGLTYLVGSGALVAAGKGAIAAEGGLLLGSAINCQ